MLMFTGAQPYNEFRRAVVPRQSLKKAGYEDNWVYCTLLHIGSTEILKQSNPNEFVNFKYPPGSAAALPFYGMGDLIQLLIGKRIQNTETD